jgi:excisionase family DNA binding protein
MKQYSTREAARKLGLDFRTIQRHIADGKVPAPPVQNLGGGKFRVWTEEQIEDVRKILPKIANGRKTRHQKSKKKQKPPAGAPVPHKPRKKKKTE